MLKVLLQFHLAGLAAVVFSRIFDFFRTFCCSELRNLFHSERFILISWRRACCIFQDCFHFSGLPTILNFRVCSTTKDLSEFHISALVAFAFSRITCKF